MMMCAMRWLSRSVPACVYMSLPCVLLMSCGGCGAPWGDSPERQDEWSLPPRDDPDERDGAAVSMERLIASAPMPASADELFDDFFFNYAASDSLQRARTVFPLPVSGAGAVDTVGEADWTPERFFMRQGYYTLIFDSYKQKEIVKDTAVCRVTVKKITFSEGTERRYIFLRSGGLWRMVGIDDVPLDEDENAAFIAFFHHFATDVTFAAASLCDPVLFEGPDPDDDLATIEGVITRDTWPAFAPDLPSDMMYTISYTSENATMSPADIGTKIFVFRGISNGFEVELSFKRVGGRWLLMKMSA